MSVTSKRAPIAFGTFEIDLDAGEIRKAGMRVRLAGQPFRVLSMLLARHGEIVSREELQREIWGDNAHVDFERGIASAVNKIREALGDSADRPLYIETLARRGFRFIAPVTVAHEPPPLAEPAPPPVASTPPIDFPVPPALVQVQAPPLLGPPLPKQEVRSTQREIAGPVRAYAWVLVGTLLVILLTSLVTYRLTQSSVLYRPLEIEQLTDDDSLYAGPPNAETLLSLATDGPRLYAPVLVNGRPVISSLDLSGAEIQPVRMPEDLNSVAITDISHDGSKLLVRSLRTREPEQPLWIVPVTGSGALRVGEILAHDATWMPGAESKVLYASGNELGMVQLDSGSISTFASLPGRAFWLRWSPDGKILRFTVLNPVTHAYSLWELAAGEQHPHPMALPQMPGFDRCCGSWTPSGDLFVFQASNARSSNLWAIGTTVHGGPVQLTNGPIRFMSPLASREGRSVFAFGMAQPAGTRIYDQKLRQFVPAPHFLTSAERLSYSRDGVWVAWTDHSGRLWRARGSDGTGALRLTGDDLEVYLARWSPDRQQLLLMARKPGETWQIYTVSASGGAIHRVLSDPRNLADPDWSADGRQVVFGREADQMGKESGPHEIQTLDLRTGAIQTVPGSTDLFSPRWSPDGLWIAALSRDQAKLLVYSFHDKTWRTLFSGGAADPVWSANSRFIYFHAFAEPSSAILRVSLDGTSQSIADLSGLRLPSVENYYFSGMAPDGSPIIEPRVGTGNIYSVALPEAPKSAKREP